MSHIIKTKFQNSLYKYLKHTLSNVLPKGRWHVMNHFIMIVIKKNVYTYQRQINDGYLRGLLAFLITMYEFDFFSKIMIALGLNYNEKMQANYFASFTKTYILRWIPGMLTSRYIMARDFIRATPAKSSVVRYNLKYMRTTVLKLYHIPDLLILNSMEGSGAIIANEAITMKIPTIGLASNNSFPAKIAFKYFTSNIDFNFIKSFIYIIMYAMETGKLLYEENNFCGYRSSEKIGADLDFKESQFMLSRKKSDILRDDFLHYKQFILLNLFNNKIEKIKKRFRYKTFTIKILYKNIKFKKKTLAKAKYLYTYLSKICRKRKFIILKRKGKKKKFKFKKVNHAKKSIKMVRNFK